MKPHGIDNPVGDRLFIEGARPGLGNGAQAFGIVVVAQDRPGLQRLAIPVKEIGAGGWLGFQPVPVEDLMVLRKNLGGVVWGMPKLRI